MSVKNVTRNSGLVYIVVGLIAVLYWQIIGAPYGILPIVFGCFFGVVSFFLVTFVEKIWENLQHRHLIFNKHTARHINGY